MTPDLSMQGRARALSERFASITKADPDAYTADILAAFSALERETVERCAKWHDLRALEWQSAYDTPHGTEEDFDRARRHEEYAAALRSLPSPASAKEET